jgi:hypothetical protein
MSRRRASICQHYEDSMVEAWPDQNEFAGSMPSSPVVPYDEASSGMFLQPETRPIKQEQLVNEVKGSLHPTPLPQSR